MSGVMHISGLPARTVGELKDALSGTSRDTVIERSVRDDEGEWMDVTRYVAVEVSPTSVWICVDDDNEGLAS